MNEIIKVYGNKINTIKVLGEDYISLTDIAREKNEEFPADVIKNWMRTKSTIKFLGLWERIKNKAGENSFVLTPKKGLSPKISHTDQGSEYRSYNYFDALKQYNISASMSRKASPWENGGQESFYGKFKFELGNLNRFNSIEEAIEAVHLQIYYYNNDRIHTALKMSPVKFANSH